MGRAPQHLVRHSELGPADLASLLGITTASVTVLVDRLENAGRRSHPQDRRRKQLVVTEHAQTEVLRALQPLFEMHRDIDEHYNEDERAVIESYLRRVSQSYERHVHGHLDGGAPTASPPL